MLLVLLSLIVFGNSVRGDFVWDDEVQVVKNPAIRSLAGVPSAFGSAFWDFAVSAETQTNFYRPVQTVTYAVAYSIAGLAPWSYHLLSILYHIIAVLVLWRILIELSFSRQASLLAASVFAAHPVHTEAVAWIAGVPDVSAGAFYFLAMWLYLLYRKQERPWLLWGSACVFFLALLAKEMAVTLPCVLLLTRSLRSGGSRFSGREIVREMAPYLAMLFAYAFVRFQVLGSFATSQVVEASWMDWISLGFQVVADYLRYALVPFPLSAYHLIPISLSFRITEAVTAVLVLGTAGFLSWRFRRKLPELPSILAAFVVTLIPVLYFNGISGAFFAERYLYIPTLATAFLVASLLDRTRHKYRFSLAWAVILLLVFTSIVRTAAWQNSESLYRITLAANDQNAQFQSNLGDIELRNGNDVAARAHFETALRSVELGHYYFTPYEEYRALIGLGALAARTQEYSDARRLLTRALEVNPAGDWAYLYLGGVQLEADGNYEGAIDNFEKAIELGPLNEVARDYMGIALLNSGRYADAIPYFQESLEINPNYADARLHLEIAERELSPE